MADRIYTTKTFLVDDGFDFVALGLADAKIWRLIRQASAHIDMLTRQWFNGEYGIYGLDSRGSVLLRHKTKLPFVYIASLERQHNLTNFRDEPVSPWLQTLPAHGDILSGHTPIWGDVNDTSRELISTNAYVNKGRYLEQVRQRLPGGVSNYIMTGAIGKLGEERYATTVTTAALTSATTTFTVDDVSGFRVRDVIDLASAFVSTRAIVTGINRVAKSITIDALDVPEDMEVGTVIRTFGNVPRAIEGLVHFLVLRQLTSNAGFAAGAGAGVGGSIKSERTDDYEYEYFDANSSGGLKGGTITGDALMDQVIVEFSRPGGAGMI